MDLYAVGRISGRTVFEGAEESVSVGFCQERKDEIWFKPQGKCRVHLNLNLNCVLQITTEENRMNNKKGSCSVSQ